MSLISFLFLLSIPNSGLAQVSTGACQAIATDAVTECNKIYELKSKQCKITQATSGGAAANAAFLAEIERCKAELQTLKAQCEGRAQAAKQKCDNDQKVAEAEKARQEAQKQNALANESTATVNWERARARLETNPIPGTIVIDPTAKAEMDSAEIQIADAREVQAQAEYRIGQLDGVIADLNSFKGQVDAVKTEALAEANAGQTGVDRGQRDVTKAVEEVGGGRTSTGSDRGDGSQRTGAAADSKGQGSNSSGNQSGNQSDNQAGKKNDEGGGQGGGGGGGMPSPQSRSDQPTPLAQPAQDCSNPQVASSNPVCACRQNPSDSRCRSILAENAGPAKKSDSEGGGSYGGGGGVGGNTGTSAEAKAAQAKNISKHGQLEQGAGGSVGKGVGSGQGSGAAAGGKAANGKQANLRDNTSSRGYGSRGGGGGGSGGLGGSSIGGGNRNAPLLGASDPRNRRAPVAATKRLTPEELRRQLQAQFNANRGSKRGPSGVVGPDGITGPHTDQFKKIRTRYADAFGL